MSSVTAVPIAPVKRRLVIYIWVGVLLALVAAIALARQGDDPLTKNARVKGVVTTESGLQFKELKAGAGTSPTLADVALVNYTGKLLNGTVFDQSRQPTPFPVGSVVPGFSEGLQRMRKGGKYRLWIKPELGYGDRATGPIPAGSTLVFDVELVDFLPEAYVRQLQAQQQQAGAGVPQP